MSINSDQSQLLDFLRTSPVTDAAKAHFKRTAAQFVLDYGWWYEPCGLPEGVGAGTPNECHKNALDLTDGDASFVYCEGFALFESNSLPVRHSWVTDGNGRAIDNTWSHPGIAYAGVPFSTKFLLMAAIRNKAVVSQLDDWQNGWPLLRDLGDQPEEWLENRGHGVSSIMGNSI